MTRPRKKPEASPLTDLVTGAEVGRRLGVSTQRAHQLAKMPGFPAPVGRVATAIVWRWPEVEAWNAQRPRKRGPARRAR